MQKDATSDSLGGMVRVLTFSGFGDDTSSSSSEEEYCSPNFESTGIRLNDDRHFSFGKPVVYKAIAPRTRPARKDA